MSESHGTDHFGNPHDDRHDRGLQYDVRTLLARRRVLGLLGPGRQRRPRGLRFEH